MRLLNKVLFPVSYNEKFYKDALELGEFARLAFFDDVIVGAVSCRVDTKDNERTLYIMTLGCLAPYRRLGVGSVMLHHILKVAEKDSSLKAIRLWVAPDRGRRGKLMSDGQSW
eukprot:m.59381 g.59381  ORF g.59381 m.59381 type:complete len:113 (-) comp7218_c0_seq1:356-694(-)